jgi:hypothetical protein
MAANSLSRFVSPGAEAALILVLLWTAIRLNSAELLDSMLLCDVADSDLVGSNPESHHKKKKLHSCSQKIWRETRE